MKRILIADASKASLVMTSEVFKDHFPGVQVIVARSSAECLELAKSGEGLDAFVIDFDLPDRDGAWTAARLKKTTQTPVLITAFDRAEVHEIIEQELAPYDDCLSWLRKPVKAELVVAVAKRYCEGRYRTQRRLDCAIPALAEIVISTTVTRTVKETVKVAVAPAQAQRAKAAATPAAGKSAASKAAASKTKSVAPAQKGKAAATSKSPAAKAPASTMKVVTKTVTDTVQAKVLVPAMVRDASLGGIKVEFDFGALEFSGTLAGESGSVSWKTQPGEILSVQLPPAEILESEEGAPAWSAWRKERFAAHAASPGVDATKATMGAASKGSKTATLSTLASKTLAAPKKSASAKAPSKDEALTVRGRVCWVEEAGKKVIFGLELENASHARRVFEVAHALHGKARNAAATANNANETGHPVPAATTTAGVNAGSLFSSNSRGR